MARLTEIVVAIEAEGTDKVLSALKQVDGAQAKVSQSSKGMGDQTVRDSERIKNNWALVATGINQAMNIANTAIEAGKQLIEYSKEGAQLDFIRSKFDRLTESIGSTSSVLLSDLRVATRGVVSDSELIGSATDFMSLGLAKTHDQVVRLTAVSGALGMNMNQLVLTLANKTTMRFDQLGVAVDGFQERLERLKSEGLSDTEAFTEAFLQQAEAQVQKVGHIADQNIGSWARLDAAKSNFFDSLKQDLSDSGSWWADFWAKAYEGMDQGLAKNSLLDALSASGQLPGGQQLTYAQRVYGTRGAYDDVLAGFHPSEYEEAARVLSLTSDAQAKLNKSMEEAGGISAAMADTMANYAAVTDETYLLNSSAYASFTSLADGAEQASESLAMSQEAFEEYVAAYSNVTSLATNFSSIIKYAESYDKTMTQIAQNNAELAKMTPWQQEHSKRGKELTEQNLQLQQSMTNMANTMTLNMMQATIAIGGITEAEAQAYFQMAADFGVISAEAADAAMTAYGNALDTINGYVIKEKTSDVKIDAAAAIATLDFLQAYVLLDKEMQIFVKANLGLGDAANDWASRNYEGGRAIGGSVSKDSPYLVGERGMELFIPNTHGMIVPNDKLDSLGKQITINFAPQVNNEFDLQRALEDLVRMINA